MRYLCLVYSECDGREAASAEERARADLETLFWEEGLRSGGHLLAGETLQPAEPTTVRVRSGELCVTPDSPPPSGRQPSGFYLLDARDLNDAIRLAARLPRARRGSVEIRPVRERPSP